MPTTEELLNDPAKMAAFALRERMAGARGDILSRARILRSVPGSGYHDNDPSGPVRAPSEEDRRSAKIEDHVIAFRCPYETHLLSGCANKAMDAISGYYATNGSQLLRSHLDQESRTLIETACEYAQRGIGADGNLVIRNAQWNTVLAVLHLQGIGVTTTAV